MRSIAQILVLLLFWTIPTLASAQQDVKPLPQLGTIEKVEPQPAKPMYHYRNGERTPLEQDFGFVAFRFDAEHPSKEFRHAFYAKIRLVVSEIQELVLLSEGYYALRLMPGATEAQWNMFISQLRGSPELSYVGRVFKEPQPSGLVDLLVTTPRLRVVWKGPVTRETMRRLEGQYPLILETVQDDGQGSVFKLRDVRVDTLELANTLFETGGFASVEPIFILLKGQPVTPDLTQRVMDGARDAMPEEMRRQLMQKAEALRKQHELLAPPDSETPPQGTQTP